MTDTGEEPRWLEILRALQGMAQTGLTYAKDPYDLARYEELRTLVAEMLEMGTGIPSSTALDAFARQIGYATPKVGVRGAIFRDNRILLVRERREQLWAMPGGWCDINQTPAECIEREIREESGLTARASRLAACHDTRLHNPPHIWHHYQLHFICEETGGTLAPSDETDDAGFFLLDALPVLSLSRNTVAQIEMMFRHNADQGLETEFDI